MTIDITRSEINNSTSEKPLCFEFFFRLICLISIPHRGTMVRNVTGRENNRVCNPVPAIFVVPARRAAAVRIFMPFVLVTFHRTSNGTCVLSLVVASPVSPQTKNVIWYPAGTALAISNE
jgi:hypothetical protein